MDRMAPSEGVDAGSIPAEGIESETLHIIYSPTTLVEIVPQSQNIFQTEFRSDAQALRARGSLVCGFNLLGHHVFFDINEPSALAQVDFLTRIEDVEGIENPLRLGE